MSANPRWKKYIGLIGILFLFPLIWLLFFGVYGKHHFNTLPYYGPDSPAEGADTTDFTVPDFSFINQDGQVYNMDSLRGKVWLAAFYSSSSEHFAKITERLLNVNWKYREERDIVIVSFSTDFTSDSAAQLNNYVRQNTRYNVFPGKWQFLTAPDSLMQGFIRDGFLINDLGSEAIFRLVDEKGQIRGLYGNTEYHMRNASEDIALLRKEIDLRAYNERRKNK